MPFQDRTLAFVYEKIVTQVDGKMQLSISSWGTDQLSDGRLSFRKYYLDENGVNRAKTIYQDSQGVD